MEENASFNKPEPQSQAWLQILLTLQRDRSLHQIPSSVSLGVAVTIRENLNAMRLLNTKTLELVSKPDNDIPAYEILSHTWGSSEVSLQEMQGFSGKPASAAGRVRLRRTERGLKKIIDAAELASSDGYEWIWIDTCCIDKTSSAELSEAINSMYRWYENSGVCYVYLEDVAAPTFGERKSLHTDDFYSSLSKSRWVTRGWTLQELIAPQLVQFHSHDWELIGGKEDRMFQFALERATGIEIGILSGQTTVAEVSVANRMKWACRRQTTRFEDTAYCLMGIFAVNMPLLYGEGEQRAFIRLQEEILKATDDQSIFAWKLPIVEDSRLMSGLLANSPAHFGGVPSMRPMSTEFQSASSVPWTMTNKGLQVQLYIRPVGERDEEEYLAILDCCLEDTEVLHAHHQGYSPSIRLRRLVSDQYTRIEAGYCKWVRGALDGDHGRYESFFVKQNPGLMLPRLALSDSLRFKSSAWHLQSVFPRNQWSENNGTFRLNQSRITGIQAVFRFGLLRYSVACPPSSRGCEADSDHLDVVIVLKRSNREEMEINQFTIAARRDNVEQTYYKLNKIWSAAPNTPEQAAKMAWIQASQHYQDSLRFVTVHLANTMRSGRGLYLLDVRERTHSGLEETPTVRFEMHGEPLEGDLVKKARAIVLLNAKTAVTVNPTSNNIKHGFFEPVFRPSKPLEYSERLGFRMHLRDEIKEIGSISDHTEFELCQAVIHENLQDIKQVLARLRSNHNSCLSETSTSANLRAIQVAVLSNNPDIMSILIAEGLDPLLESRHGHTALQLASMLGNSGVIQPLLQQATRPEFDLVSASTYKRSMASFRPHIGSEAKTGHTALHLAAMCCSGEEFASILAQLFEATGAPESEWDESEAKLERQYLFGLRNEDGETVLHGAIELGNLEVVELICTGTPEVVTRLDNFNRSTVWHVASHGDMQMLKAVMKAYSLCINPPYLHLSDDNGLTPLHVACWRGHLELVQELLTCGGIQHRMTTFFGFTPAMLARRNGQSHVADFLEGLNVGFFL